MAALGIPEALREPKGFVGDSSSSIFDGSEEKVAYVGGGISGIEAAKISLASGKQVVIIERAPFMGGVWCTAANKESRIQVDPISFRPIEDQSPVKVPDAADPFDSIYPNRQEVLARLAGDVLSFGLEKRVAFRTEVTKFEGLEGGVRVFMRTLAADGSAGEEFSKVFRELHVRTGSLTSHRGGEFRLPNEARFGGTVARGIGGDLELASFMGKRVVIVGMGAFAVENTRRALQAGATSITVLSRKFDKLLFPESATYMLRSRLQAEDAFEEENITDMWRTVYGLVATAATVCGLEDVILNAECVRTVGGEKHFVFSNGLPSMASNVMFLAYHYGLVDIYKDEVSDLTEGAVLTKGGREIPADIVLKCVGFGTEEAMMRGHTVVDSFFIDGETHVTHNLRGDRVNGENLIGPNVAVSNFLISYYEDAQEYERCIGRLNEAPAAFEEMLAMAPQKNYGLVSGVDYFSTLVLSDKLARSSDAGMQAILEQNRATRRALYEKFLPEEQFFAVDAACWNKLAAHFAEKTGKPALPYPFSPTASA
mmetsp:Transcript_20355/g.77926  ORF Transcript_20355/g.77926 Transcript_20355/m.77926 type:complete len:540 (+) Transcript_20355:75-1694(+)